MLTQSVAISANKIAAMVVSLLVSFVVHNALAHSAPSQPMVIKYHFSIPADNHRRYNVELIQRALEVTRPEFGDFSVQTYSQAPVAARQTLLLNEGELLNMQWSSPGTEIAKAEVIEIPIDISRGLQGYRVCLINKDTEFDFSTLTTVESLRKLRIAQGAGWGELPIYYYNGIRPQEPPTMSGLYPMLGLKRFDCVPLGINEINTIIDLEKLQYPFLAIEKTLLIYYYFPIYLYVSNKFPEIAKRIALGLEKIKASGEFDQLVRKHYLKNIQNLNLQTRRVICLRSPFSSNPRQCEGVQTLPDLLKME